MISFDTNVLFAAWKRDDPNHRAAAGLIGSFADSRAFFAKMAGEVDAVIVATNQQTHVPIAISAMRRGMHVYLEKPIAYCEHEADLLAAAAKKYGVVTQAGHHGHSGPFQPLVAEYIQSGSIGQVRSSRRSCWATWWRSPRATAGRASSGTARA